MIPIYDRLIESFISFRPVTVQKSNNYILRLSSELLTEDCNSLDKSAGSKVSGTTYNYSGISRFLISTFKRLFGKQKEAAAVFSGLSDFNIFCLDSGRMLLNFESAHSIRHDLVGHIAAITPREDYRILLEHIRRQPLVIVDMCSTEGIDESARSELANESVYLLDSNIITTRSLTKVWFDRAFIGKVLGFLLSSPRLGIQKIYSLLAFLGFRSTLQNSLNYNAYMLTSNSFVAECFRFYAIADDNCIGICEFSHGVNSLIINDYIKSIQDIEINYSGEVKLKFIEQLPGVPMSGVKNTHLKFDNDLGVNVGLNRFLRQFDDNIDHLTTFLRGKVVSNCRETKISDRQLYIVILGYSDFQSDHTELDSFMIEIFLIDQVKAILRKQKISHTILYSCHPASDYQSLQRDERMKSRSVNVVRDTWASHFFCDVSIGLFSAATYEAEFVGSKGFQPMLQSDGLHSQDYLDWISSPAKPGREGVVESLEFLLNSCDPINAKERQLVISKRLEKLGLVV